MSTINQKDYLKKYLSIGKAPGKLKKKKRKLKGISNRVKIIDDDADNNSITIEDDPLQVKEDEDAPQIVAVIDERPPSMRIDEKTNSHMWEPIGDFGTIEERKLALPIKRIESDLEEVPTNIRKSTTKHKQDDEIKVIRRDRKTGKIRNLVEEAEHKKQKDDEKRKNKQKYDRWGRGLAQIEHYEQKIQDEIQEMNKPLARYADDVDLERYLKDQERDGDPMLAYIRSKQRKQDAKEGKSEKPVFEGQFMPNRFAIRPGHRWDGVDRSSGYEKKWFEVQNAKQASLEENYKWSTEDM